MVGSGGAGGFFDYFLFILLMPLTLDGKVYSYDDWTGGGVSTTGGGEFIAAGTVRG